MENNVSLTEEKKNSIVLKKNVKGEFAWDIKVYFNDDKEKAVQLVEDINIALKTKYGG